MPRSGTREPKTRKPTTKVVENERQKAKTASLIRKRSAGPRRAVSQSQPQAQGLDQLAEAARGIRNALLKLRKRWTLA